MSKEIFFIGRNPSTGLVTVPLEIHCSVYIISESISLQEGYMTALPASKMQSHSRKVFYMITGTFVPSAWMCPECHLMQVDHSIKHAAKEQ